ncbi:MAG: hypothetical protein WCD45_06665, partial [Gallionella sp.]
TQSGAGAVLRTLHDKELENISSKDFGALCNGSSNDTTQLQAAINATPSGGRLRLVAGDCKVTGLTINRPITIVGDGFGSVTAGVASNAYVGGTRISPFGVVNGYLITVQRASVINNEGNLYGVNLSNIYFEGGQRAAATGGLQLAYLDHSYFEDLRFDSFQRPAISLSKSVRESAFNRIATKFCGNNTVDGYDPVHNFPAISIIDTATVASDGTNQIKFTNSNIVYSLGDSVVLDSLSGASGGVRQITFHNMMFHGILPAMATQIPGVRGVITARQSQYSHLISAADKVTISSGNMTYMGSDTPSIIQRASTDGTVVSPRIRVDEYWLEGRFDASVAMGSAYGVLLAAGYASLSNMLINNNYSGVIKTLPGTTIDVDWNTVKIGAVGAQTSQIMGALDNQTSSYSGQLLSKTGMSYTYGTVGAAGEIPDGSNQTSAINIKVSNDAEGSYGGQLGFTAQPRDVLSQPWWRSNVAGNWGAWRKVATENPVVNIVPITSYVQVAGAGMTAYTVTKAMTYIAGAAGQSLALTLPAASAAIDGITVTVVSNQTRPSVTWSSRGATFVGVPTTLMAATPVKLQYLHSSGQWWITQ